MPLKSLLLSLPVDQWHTQQAIVLDWYDGPRQGVCSLAKPGGEFRFELLDERPTADDLDDRLFSLSELPAGSVAEVLAVLQELGSPAAPVWVPLWQFPSEAARRNAEQHLQKLQTKAQPSSLVISTRDMQHFRGCWPLTPSATGANWFTLLGIPNEQTSS